MLAGKISCVRSHVGLYCKTSLAKWKLPDTRHFESNTLTHYITFSVAAVGNTVKKYIFKLSFLVSLAKLHIPMN